MELSFVILPLLAFLAYLLKAMTGFGPAIVIVSLGSLFIHAQPLIALSSVLDLIAGAILLTLNWKNTTHSFWIPLAISIVIGSVIGGIFLKVVPPLYFHYLLSSAILIIGIWFITNREATGESELLKKLPEKCTKIDTALTFLGGLCGGMFGISGPPIIWNFGRQFKKVAFRQVLIPIFFTASIARVSVYTSIDLVNWQVLKYVLVSLPGLALGLYTGNKIFFKLSELKFRRVVGIILVAVSIKLLFFHK